jgi:hypothetical protein
MDFSSRNVIIRPESDREGMPNRMVRIIAGGIYSQYEAYLIMTEIRNTLMGCKRLPGETIDNPKCK